MIEIYCDNKFLFKWENPKDVPNADRRKYFINNGILYQFLQSIFFGNVQRIFIKKV